MNRRFKKSVKFSVTWVSSADELRSVDVELQHFNKEKPQQTTAVAIFKALLYDVRNIDIRRQPQITVWRKKYWHKKSTPNNCSYLAHTCSPAATVATNKPYEHAIFTTACHLLGERPMRQTCVFLTFSNPTQIENKMPKTVKVNLYLYK